MSEVYPNSCQTSKIELSTKMKAVNYFHKKLDLRCVTEL